eukprot:5090890-Alexandrium_andersonii.AAC.1
MSPKKGAPWPSPPSWAAAARATPTGDPVPARSGVVPSRREGAPATAARLGRSGQPCGGESTKG